MNEEYPEKSSRGLINLLLIIAIVVGIIAMMWKVGIFGKAAEDVEINATEEVVAAATDEDFSITKSEWTTMQKQLKQLQNEVKTLQTEIKALGQNGPTTNKSISTSITSTTTNATAKNNAITLEKYTHDGDWMTASLSFKNNTSQTIKSFKGRIIYLDMKGNMLDYVDITPAVNIEPGYVKAIELNGYAWDKGYSYYKSEASILSPDRKYKVKFELKSYSVK